MSKSIKQVQNLLLFSQYEDTKQKSSIQVNMSSNLTTSLIPILYFSNETFHACFGHSHQIIALNDCMGLGQLDESPLEAKQKFVRRFREHLTRKHNQDKCMEDTMNRLFLQSCAALRKHHPKKMRNRKSNGQLSDDDEIFNTYFVIKE